MPFSHPLRGKQLENNFTLFIRRGVKKEKKGVARERVRVRESYWRSLNEEECYLKHTVNLETI